MNKRYGEVIELNYQGKVIIFSTHTPLQRERVLALANYLQNEPRYGDGSSKLIEPDTLRWISEFKNAEILYDIGANMGIFSIFAAIVYGVKVKAFEPSLNEAKSMTDSIFLNGISDSVNLFGGCALSNEVGFDLLYMQRFSDFRGNFWVKKKMNI